MRPMACGHSMRKEQCDQLLTFFFFLQNYFFSLSFPFHLLSINVVCTVKNVVFSDLSSWVGNTWDLEIIIVREMVPLTAAFLLAFQFHSWPR